MFDHCFPSGYPNIGNQITRIKSRMFLGEQDIRTMKVKWGTYLTIAGYIHLPTEMALPG